SGTKVVEGWKYSTSNSYLNISHSAVYSDCSTDLTISRQFDYLNNSGTNKKVSQESLATSRFVQTSVSEIALAGITDYRAKGSDLACMLMGVNSSSYCSYSTRDLYDISSGKYITVDGTVRNLWLNKNCGIRYSFASTGKSS
ncbi:MAG: hypothetical protein J6J24_05050, partial [Clostridia bacterium]|nr:hypothetical protein [Clostridia bacterium]